MQVRGNPYNRIMLWFLSTAFLYSVAGSCFAMAVVQLEDPMPWYGKVFLGLTLIASAAGGTYALDKVGTRFAALVNDPTLAKLKRANQSIDGWSDTYYEAVREIAEIEVRYETTKWELDQALIELGKFKAARYAEPTQTAAASLTTERTHE